MKVPIHLKQRVSARKSCSFYFYLKFSHFKKDVKFNQCM